jgi:ABC-type Zn2+ transport system substrate-binding protein/surface adhesin
LRDFASPNDEPCDDRGAYPDAFLDALQDVVQQDVAPLHVKEEGEAAGEHQSHNHNHNHNLHPHPHKEEEEVHTDDDNSDEAQKASDYAVRNHGANQLQDSLTDRKPKSRSRNRLQTQHLNLTLTLRNGRRTVVLAMRP